MVNVVGKYSSPMEHMGRMKVGPVFLCFSIIHVQKLFFNTCVEESPLKNPSQNDSNASEQPN